MQYQVKLADSIDDMNKRFVGGVVRCENNIFQSLCMQITASAVLYMALRRGRCGFSGFIRRMLCSNNLRTNGTRTYYFVNLHIIVYCDGHSLFPTWVCGNCLADVFVFFNTSSCGNQYYWFLLLFNKPKETNS